MICPNCGRGIAEGTVCPACGWRAEDERDDAFRKPRRTLPPLLWAVCWAVALAFVSVGLYRGYYWLQAEREKRVYESGRLQEPAIDQITLDDGRAAHAITFYGDDGDLFYIEELRRSYLVIDGVARVEIADSDWFEFASDDVVSAEITLTPMLTTVESERVALPEIQLSIEAPESPLVLVNPADGWAETYASTYILEATVVPGSKVLIDGEDVTDFIDFQGNLSVNAAVYPIGENVISLLVSTPNHKQTRRDITLYREAFEIPVEITSSVPAKTNMKTLTVSGKTEAGASIAVDSAVVEGSVKLDAEGSFSFDAQFSVIGDNTIRMRAVREGKRDSVVSYTVYYLPPLAEYSRNAWKMDYTELSKYYETWKGRVFLCRGTIVDTISLEPKNLIVMNVGNEHEPKYVVLENLSSVAQPLPKTSYDAYADVSGVYKYNGVNIPYLIARYMDQTK